MPSLRTSKALLVGGTLLVLVVSLTIALPGDDLPGLLDLTAQRLDPPPEITLASPGDGDGVGGRVTLAGQALSTTRDVADVQYRIDSGRWESAAIALRGQPTTPFAVDLDIPAGDHLLEVRATDGETRSLVARALVRRDAPTVTILAPLHGDAVTAGHVTIAGTVRGNAPTVQLEVAGVVLQVPVEAGSWRAGVDLPPGPHLIRATALGAVRSLPRTVELAAGVTPPPQIHVASPRADASYGAVGDITCGGGCILASGTAPRAAVMRATLDGLPFQAPTLLADTWTLRIPMVSLASGPHELRIEAEDIEGQQAVARSVRFLAHTPHSLAIRGDDVPAATSTPLAFEVFGDAADTANWTLDGEPLAQGRTLVFEMARPGDHLLTVHTQATRGRSATASLPLHALNRLPTLAFLGEPLYLHGAHQFHVQATDADGIIASLAWDFGDGSFSNTTLPTILHRYTERGTHDVSVTAYDDQGGATTIHTTLTVANAAPEANFTWTPEAPTILDIITLQDRSIDHDGVLGARLWRLPDGTASEDDNLTLRLRTRGPHSITLHVTDDQGLATQVEHTITVHDIAPTPDFRHEPLLPKTHEEILFGDRSTDPDGPILRREWDFGDGTNTTGEAALHIYRQPGDYTVRLRVTDDLNATAEITRNITIQNSHPLVRAVTVEPAEPTAQEEAHFVVTAEDRDGAIIAADWDFGDGTNASGLTPIHRYARSGTYTTHVTVYDEAGLTLTYPFLVRVQNAPPALTLRTAPHGQIAGFPTTLIANATDPDGHITFHRFDADGDGTTDCETPEPQCAYTYPTSGTYVAHAWAEDDEGATTQATILLDITLPPPDHPPPTVHLESPAPGATLRGEHLLRGTATGPRNISKVELQLRQDAWTYSGSRDPWRTLTGTREWRQLIDTRAFADGAYDLVLRATDTDGGTGITRTPITIQNGPRPSDITIHLVAPPATIDDDVTLRASAFHPQGITHIRWRIDNDTWTTETENPLAFTLDIRPHTLVPGDHTLQIQASHGITDTTQLTHPFTTPGQTPTLIIDDPPAPTAHALLHAEGRIHGQGRAQWRLDQGTWQDLPPGPTWTLHQDTDRYPNGRHTITLRATSPDGHLHGANHTYKIDILNPPFDGEERAAPAPRPTRDTPAPPLAATLALFLALAALGHRRRAK